MIDTISLLKEQKSIYIKNNKIIDTNIDLKGEVTISFDLQNYLHTASCRSFIYRLNAFPFSSLDERKNILSNELPIFNNEYDNKHTKQKYKYILPFLVSER